MSFLIITKGGGDLANQTKSEATINALKSPTKINSKKDISINTKNDKKVYTCSCCGSEYGELNKNFSPTNLPLFKGTGYYPVCKKCMDQFFIEMTEIYSGNEEQAIKYICQMTGVYFNPSPLGASRKISQHRSRLSTYISKVQINPWIGKTYIDTLKDEFEIEGNNVIETFEDVKDSKNTKLKTVKFFGTGFTDDDYQFLEDEYKDWTTRHECSTKSQEEVFKQICYAQLDILKAKRENQPTKDLTRTFQDLLATANLQPKQTRDNTLAEQNTFGTLIRKWENERPIPEPDDEWKDVDGIAKYITVYFLGHLCKMMGIKNSYSRMYEAEMAKYKVEKPEYEDDDEALFDAVFSQQLDGEDV